MYVYTEDNHILIVLDQAVLISPQHWQNVTEIVINLPIIEFSIL
jgi:hypothetical protein